MDQMLMIKNKVDELILLDKNFDELKNDYIIKQEFILLNEFMEKRTILMNEIKELISNKQNLTQSEMIQIENDIKETTLIATSKCKSIQQELKSRIISSNKHKQAFQYFNNNNPVNPTFIDKTV